MLRPYKENPLGLVRLAAFEGDEITQWVGQRWGEGVEAEGLRDVEACGFGGGDVGKWRQGCESLFDVRPAECALIAIVVGRIGGFGDALCAGDVRDGAAVLRRDI